MNKRKMQKILTVLVVSCFTFLISAAQPNVKTSINKNEILIGEQFTINVKAGFSGDDYYIKWVQLPDTLQHFELIEKSKIDSVFSREKLSGLSQNFTFTSFDSGKWTFPSIKINFTPVKDDTTINVFTDSLPIVVSFSMADTSKILKDIKAIRTVEITDMLWYWIVGALLLLIVAIGAWWWYSKRKKSTPIESVQYSLSAYEEAMHELGRLSNYDLSVVREIQQYHTKLIEIFRQYLSRKENSNYISKTTGEILMAINSHYLNKEILSKCTTAIRVSDAVKFAKYVPAETDSQNNKQIVKEAIELIESSSTYIKP
jgi:hypothetical protein